MAVLTETKQTNKGFSTIPIGRVELLHSSVFDLFSRNLNYIHITVKNSRLPGGGVGERRRRGAGGLAGDGRRLGLGW